MTDITILFVDDDQDIREILKSSLSIRYSHVITAANGLEGVEMYKKHSPHIVITDLRMPDMDGFEMSKEIKKLNNDTYIIATTAHNESEYILEALNIGIKHYITKPIENRRLYEYIDEYIENSKNREDAIKNAKLLKKLNQNLEKKVEEEVAKNNEQTKLLFQQAKYAQMGEMLSMIAHQWRQPLNAVSSAAINLKMDVELDSVNEENIVEQASFIEQQASKMSQTINDFMNFFKPEKEKEKFTLMEIINEIKKIIGAQLKTRNIVFESNISKDIALYGYKNEFEHVLLNIYANARDAFNENENEKKIISTTITETREQAIIDIEDNAGGIPTDIIEKVFNPYFTTKLESHGTGIGLYMSKMIVEKNFAGTIQVKNRENGALFTVSIPLKN